MAYSTGCVFHKIYLFIGYSESGEDTDFEQMEKKEVVIGNPVAVAGVTVIPVAKVLLRSWLSRSGISVLAIKQPVAVAVISPLAKRAFRVTGEEISLDQLVQEAPCIKEVLETV